MTTILLAFLVVLINLFIYGSQNPKNYDVATHLYYGVMILAGIYDGRRGQRILLALTTLATWLHVVFYYEQPHLAVVAILYPFIAFFIVRTIRFFKAQGTTTETQIREIDQVNIDLKKRVRDLSTLFEISEPANAALELDELFQRIIKILADRMGVYRGTLRIWEDGVQVKTVQAAFGLTEAERKRGTDSQIDEIQKKVMESGEPIGVPHTRTPLPQIDLPDARAIQSKDPIAFWCVPVIVDEQVIGTLTIDKASDEFSIEDDIRVLTIIASIVAQRVKIQQMIDSLVQAERLATLGKLATTVAHEVRNPLGGIRGAAQLLQLESDPDSETQEYIAVVIKEVDRLNRVVEQLLGSGNPRTAGVKPNAIADLIDNSLSICQPEFDQSNIHVEKIMDEGCPPVVVNADGMMQVLLNLFRNAIESMEADGVLTIQTQYRVESQIVQICIQDTGRGISPDVARRLFDPFYTTKQKGTGLGLAISQQIIEEHGGTIEVDVTQSQGAAFIISLPA
ncbi:MAG: ATP-binding protein [Candidatus Poribacteria bacterium]|nr:ATP-binding protein [Candidatus Poribacteria bacterium]